MKSTILTLLVASALCVPLLVQARVCMVYDFDTSGCKKGDDLLFMPSTFGNEQYPIEFAGKKCDLSKPITLNKGGVVCTYAGPKDVVEGYEEKVRMAYGGLYKQVKANPEGWVLMDDDRYWRVHPTLTGKAVEKNAIPGPIKIGDHLKLYYAKCIHDANGKESLGNYEPDGDLTVNADYHLWQAGPLRTGTILEIVGPKQHGFLRVEHVPNKKSK